MKYQIIDDGHTSLKKVWIMKHRRTGARFAKIEGRAAQVPFEICGLAGGRDAWMRDIEFRCTDCRKPTRAGDFDGSTMCPTCTTAYFSCKDCGGEHHPEDGCELEPGDLPDDADDDKKFEDIGQS